MGQIQIYQLDAFTGEQFKGNPAAVCVLSEWLNSNILQSIATENNLPETAFVVIQKNRVEIRWFTPTVEVDLCGHATLASAFVLFNYYFLNQYQIELFSSRSGVLKVLKQNELIVLDFPTDILFENLETEKLSKCMNVPPLEIFKGRTDYIVVVENEEQVYEMIPDFTEISTLNARGLIVTAPGKKVDYVCRFFAPQTGINEDPATGSAQTSLIPLWSEKLGKKELTALQLSERGGTFYCNYLDERCQIGGMVKLYMIGKIYMEEL